MHHPITFATKFSAQGVVEHVEIMVYREPRGDAVRDPRFRKQFKGRTARDEIRLGRDVYAVSGATVSGAGPVASELRGRYLEAGYNLLRVAAPSAITT